MLYLFALSMGLSVATVGFLCLVGIAAYKTGVPLFETAIRVASNSLGIPFSLVLSGIVLFIVYLFALSRPSIRYVMEISRGIEQIAGGNFEFRLPIRTEDELGALADNLNKMTVRLSRSIEEERRSERAKAELVTNVSHDLRTPLTSIVGYLGLVDDDRYRDEVELRQYVRIAHEKSLHLKALINDLFEYTRTSGGMSLRLSPLNLAEMIGQLAAQFSLQFEQAGMECKLAVFENPIVVNADAEKLVRVFENLIANAIQYGRDGGRIDLTVRREGRQAVAEVANYGESLPASSLPRLFERFYRGEHSRSRETGGSGLGLAIAKNIVELHGGAISAASQDGRTSFEVRLPGASAAIL